MSRKITQTLLSLALLASTFGAALAGNSQIAVAQTKPRFEEADCAKLLAPDTNNPLAKALTNAAPIDPLFQCGYVTVAEEHAKPNGKTIKIAVVVMKANGESGTVDDPLFMMQGGPGGATISTYSTILRNLNRDDAAPRAKRDIVLFDQRGTGKSQPALLCPELYQLTLETVEQRLGYDESLSKSSAAIDACRKRMVAEGVNLNAFDSVENAADVEDIRQALNYDRINLYGVSYGTLLALHTLRDHPEHLRSVIIDGVVPTQSNFLIEATRSMNRAFSEFFAACAADARCNKDYPNLEKVFFDLVAQYEKAPARARVSDPDSGRSYSAFVDGNTLMAWLFQSMYSAQLVTLIPHTIYDLNAGRTESLGTVLSLFAFEKSIANGMYFSVICAEDADYSPAQAASWPGLRPQIVKNAERDAASTLAICKQFNVEPLPAMVDDPVASDLPVLVLNGRFDPITPAGNGEEAAKTLPNSHSYTFPNTAHGAFPGNDCATEIVQSFLDAPGGMPDSSCIAQQKPLKFIGANDVVRTPVMGELLTATPRDRQIQFSIYALALLLLLTGILLLPLGWLARLIFSKNHATLKPPFIANLMPWLVFLNCALAALLISVLVGQAFSAAGANDYSFLVGISAEYRWAFVLPIVIVLFTLLIVWGVIAGWRSGAWGLGRKLYRSTLALASVAICVVLLVWGMVVLPLLG
jgi:pimeloyl-ACP methyl ester carboxylesterase